MSEPGSEAGFHLFAYGTLTEGSDAPADLMAGCRKVAAGSVNGTLYALDRFPALLLGGRDEIPGEVWWCPADRLPALDRYEGVEDGLFRRVATRVDGYACWVYVAGPRLGPRLLPDAVVPGIRRAAPLPGDGSPTAGPPRSGEGS